MIDFTLSVPFSNVRVSRFNVTLSSPESKFNVFPSVSSLSLNKIGDFCVSPCGPEVAESLPVGVTSITVGVYVVSTFVPLASLICTLTAVAVPTNVFLGVNVIVLLTLSNTYSPWSVVTVFVSAPEASSNVNDSLSNSTCSPVLLVCDPLSKLTVFALSTFSSVVFNTILETCGFPWTSLVVAASAVGATGVILGVYVASVSTVKSLSSLSWSIRTGTETLAGFTSPV